LSGQLEKERSDNIIHRILAYLSWPIIVYLYYKTLIVFNYSNTGNVDGIVLFPLLIVGMVTLLIGAFGVLSWGFFGYYIVLRLFLDEDGWNSKFSVAALFTIICLVAGLVLLLFPVEIR
jgi:hypothetical protein